MHDAIAAIDEETYDSLEEAHMSWTPLIVDEEGWKELVEILCVALEGVLSVGEHSAERLMANDEGALHAPCRYSAIRRLLISEKWARPLRSVTSRR
jgi:hypothetical protein